MASAMAMLFLGCKDTYVRVGEEAAKPIYPMDITENFALSYTEAREPLQGEGKRTTKVIAVLTGPLTDNYNNLVFPYRTFPEGLHVDLFDESGNKNVIVADYGIKYSITNMIDLQGNVVVEGHDGKKLETQQLFFDQANEWVFTQGKFKFTNPADGTIIYGEGMDVRRDLKFLNAHRTDGVTMIKEGSND